MEQKDVLEMTDRELLEEIALQARRETKYRISASIFRLILLAALVIFCWIYIPKMVTVAEKYLVMIEEIRSMLVSMQEYMENMPLDEEELKTILEAIKVLSEQISKLAKLWPFG